MLLWGVWVHTVAVGCGDWEKSNILILRSIVCEIPFCCPKCVTVSLIRNDSLGGEGRFHRRRLLSGGDGWGGVGGQQQRRGHWRAGITSSPGFWFLIHFTLSTTQQCLKTQRRDQSWDLAPGKALLSFFPFLRGSENPEAASCSCSFSGGARSWRWGCWQTQWGCRRMPRGERGPAHRRQTSREQRDCTARLWPRSSDAGPAGHVLAVSKRPVQGEPLSSEGSHLPLAAPGQQLTSPWLQGSRWDQAGLPPGPPSCSAQSGPGLPQAGRCNGRWPRACYRVHTHRHAHTHTHTHTRGCWNPQQRPQGQAVADAHLRPEGGRPGAPQRLDVSCGFPRRAGRRWERDIFLKGSPGAPSPFPPPPSRSSWGERRGRGSHRRNRTCLFWKTWKDCLVSALGDIWRQTELPFPLSSRRGGEAQKDDRVPWVCSRGFLWVTLWPQQCSDGDNLDAGRDGN